MSSDIHGHQILTMLMQATQPIQRESLTARVIEMFGEEVTFCTCSQQGLSLDDLLTFLLSKGKIIEQDAGLIGNPAMSCS
jgi:probable metal-binding protein